MKAFNSRIETLHYRWFTWAWIRWHQRGLIRGGKWCHTGVKSTKLEHGACPSLSSVVRKPPCGHRTPYPINLYCGLQHSPSMEPSDGSDLTTTHTPISNYQSISTTHISQFTVTKTLYYNTCITSLATSWHITEIGEYWLVIINYQSLFCMTSITTSYDVPLWSHQIHVHLNHLSPVSVQFYCWRPSWPKRPVIICFGATFITS